MSAFDDNSYDRLLAGHCNRDLRRGETEELHALARSDAGRAREVREIEAIHRALDAERQLFAVAVAPLEPREEADEVYRRLCRRAAAVEREIREASRGPLAATLRSRVCRRAMPRATIVAAAAAVIVTVAYALGVFSSREPDDLRLRGTPRILLKKEISMQSREISWYEVVGARSYDVVVTDADNRVVLARPAEETGSTTWELNPDQYRILANHEGPLYLRVVAFDGSGFELGSTGDRILKIR